MKMLCPGFCCPENNIQWLTLQPFQITAPPKESNQKAAHLALIYPAHPLSKVGDKGAGNADLQSKGIAACVLEKFS